MFEVSLQGKTFNVEKEGEKLLLNGKSLEHDTIWLDKHRMHLLINGKGYKVELLRSEGKEMVLQVNGARFELQLRNELDLMLGKMGINIAAEQKINELKAPMPGLVLRVMVEAGQEVQKGDPLLVLESMKMENVLKSPGQGVVDKILATVGATVEKGAVLLHFG